MNISILLTTVEFSYCLMDMNFNCGTFKISFFTEVTVVLACSDQGTLQLWLKVFGGIINSSISVTEFWNLKSEILLLRGFMQAQPQYSKFEVWRQEKVKTIPLILTSVTIFGGGLHVRVLNWIKIKTLSCVYVISLFVFQYDINTNCAIHIGGNLIAQ